MEKMEKPGYEFGGWYVDEACTRRVNPAAKLLEHIRLYEKWSLIDYPIIYELEEGMNSPYNPRSYNVESGMLKLYPAVLKGKQFAGWMQDGKRVSCIDPSACGPIRLTGRFQQPAVLSFDTGKGSRINDLPVPADGSPFVLPIPRRLGYDFAGWYYDARLLHPVHEQDSFFEDTKLYADWKLQEFDLTYDLDGGIFLDPPVLNYTCLTPTFLLPQAAKEDAAFEGWHDERGNLCMMIRKGTIGSKKLKATWKEEPTVRISVPDPAEYSKKS